MGFERSKSELSRPRRELLELMQRIGFGQIEGLAIYDGEPELDPLPKIRHEIKCGAEENGPRPQTALENFLLKKQVIELFELFDRIGDGVIDVLEIKHGLPFRVFRTGIPV